MKSGNLRGFTLIELLLVIGVMAILAAIVIVAINPQKQLGQSEDARRAQSENQLEKAFYQYLIDEEEFPGDRSVPEGVAQAVPICRTSYAETGGSGCINLDILLDPAQSYVACLPRDGDETNVAHSGYAVYQEMGRAHVVATHTGEGPAESGCEKLLAPIAYWKLDETSGNASDSSGNSSTMTNNGTTSFTGAKSLSNGALPARQLWLMPRWSMRTRSRPRFM